MEEFKRGLSKQFLDDLEKGKLKVLLDEVKRDHTLCLAIRNKYINIYYRGGNICKVNENPQNYSYSFDKDYIENDKDQLETVFKRGNIKEIVENFPKLKHEMDIHFSSHKKLEREFQQLILRENNYSVISNDTDYFIADIEYANTKNKSRFDMLAIKWLSTSAERRSLKKINLAFIEVKYGDKAIDGNSGIAKHAEDIYKFLRNEKEDIYIEVERMINQQIRLGLINVSQVSKEVKITEEKPEFIFLFANHKPSSTKLKTELKKITELEFYKDLTELCDIKIATSVYMGYGLYSEYVKPLEQFLNEN